MKISVVIAAYNGADYIREQLESIRNQSIVPHEIVISDDGSTDNTCDIAAEFARNNPDIAVEIIQNQAPHGVDHNFANALRHVNGDIIFICDQDDVWLPCRVEKMLSAFDGKTPSATFCDSSIVDSKLNPLGFTHIQSRGFASIKECFASDSKAFLKRVPPAGHDMAFSREFLDILLPFPDLRDCYDTWIGLVLYALGAWNFSCDQPLTLFRRHQKSVTRSGLIPSFSEKLVQAQKAVKDDTSNWYALLYAELISRTQNRITPEMLELLEARRRHSLTRGRMNTAFFQRTKLVLQETFNGNYFRFGRSFANIIQDLLLRRPKK